MTYNGSPLYQFSPQYNFNDVSTWRNAMGKWSPNLTGQKNGSNVSTPTPSKTNSIYAGAASALSQTAGDVVGNLFEDTGQVGQALGNIFSTGISTSLDTMANNVIKGNALTYGLGKNLQGALSGTAAGLAGNLVGKGITSAMGNSMLGKGVGAGVASGMGEVGGRLLSGQGLAGMNYGALGMSVAGAALQAALGPGREVSGKHGDITRGFDMAHNIISTAANFLPGAQFISAGLALNKGAKNLFGSTDAQTKTDATLAGIGDFIAPVQWLNMANAKTTGLIHNESWQREEARKAFMQGSFGNIGSRIKRAKEDAGKTYGTFSHRQYKRDQANVAFADRAKSMIDDMTKQNEIQNIRSTAMTSVNNQRYQQNIQGGPKLSYLGRYGMKLNCQILSKACKDLD